MVHFHPFCFWLFWCLISSYFKAVGCFGQSKNTIPLVYTIPKLHRRTTVHNLTMIDNTLKFRFHWQLSILVEKFHFCSSDSSLKISGGGLEPPCPSPCYGPAYAASQLLSEQFYCPGDIGNNVYAKCLFILGWWVGGNKFCALWVMKKCK